MKKLKRTCLTSIYKLMRFFSFSKVHTYLTYTPPFEDIPIIYIFNNKKGLLDTVVYDKYNCVVFNSKRNNEKGVLSLFDKLSPSSENNAISNMKKCVSLLKKRKDILYSFDNQQSEGSFGIDDFIRLSLKTIDKVQIIPLSISYQNSEEWRSDAYIIQGEPFVLESGITYSDNDFITMCEDALANVTLYYDNPEMKKEEEQLAYMATFFETEKSYPKYLFNFNYKSESVLQEDIKDQLDSIKEQAKSLKMITYKDIPVFDYSFKKIDITTAFLYLVCIIGFILNLPAIFIQEMIIRRINHNKQIYRSIIGLAFMFAMSILCLISGGLLGIAFYLFFTLVSLQDSKEGYLRIAGILNMITDIKQGTFSLRDKIKGLYNKFKI